jgi:hypothetical protein
MLAPLVLLASASTLPRKGLSECRLQPPAWWEEPVTTAAPPGEAPGRRAVRTTRPTGLFDGVETGETVPQPTAPTTAPAPVRPGLSFEALLRSEVYVSQKELVQKHLPDDATVLRVLEALDGHGGTLTFPALAQQADVLPLRLDGLLAKMQRLLNVDGYEVLEVDRVRNRVALNGPLLRRQFELE